jgi:NAD(P)-dependent dehydrogenase (short-subunit alcohol dehydrogenase family)
VRTLLVTGATGDLGAVVLPRLLQDYRCVALYRSEESWRRLAKHPNLVGIPKLDDVRSHAPIFALVNLAGGFRAGSSPEDFAAMFETNVMPTVQAVQAARPHFEESGRVIAISSMASLTKPKGLAAYSASKAALNAFIETLAKEMPAHVLLPETIDTDEKREKIAGEIVRLLRG